MNCPRSMTICSVYLPPKRPVGIGELRQLLVKQLPKPFMLQIDSNGHHTTWGCRDINPRGRIIEDFLSDIKTCASSPMIHRPTCILLLNQQHQLTYPCVIPIYIWTTLGWSMRISVAVITIQLSYRATTGDLGLRRSRPG